MLTKACHSALSYLDAVAMFASHFEEKHQDERAVCGIVVKGGDSAASLLWLRSQPGH